MLASGVIAVGTVSMLPVGVAFAAGGAAVGGGLVLSGAKRWNDGQATIDVVAGAAADTTGVTSFSLGLWGRDPVTGQEVPLTPEQGTYELIVGASSISMLVGMPFANGLRGPTTSIPWPKPQLQFVESFSVVGDTLVASPVRFPAITWTKGAIEVSHQGVAIGSAYASTTRIVAMMASGPMPNGAPTPSPRSQELIDILAPGGQPIGVRLGGARDSIRTLPGGEPAAEAMFQRLIAGRNPVDITPPTYQGRLVRLDDGSIIGFRPTSTSGPRHQHQHSRLQVGNEVALSMTTERHENNRPSDLGTRRSCRFGRR